MDIIYKKDTLYVYLDDSDDSEAVGTLEDKVDHIMSTYNIDNLVINTKDDSREDIQEFESKFNSKHRSKVIIK